MATETLTYDILEADGGARLPSLDDLGGAQIVGDTTNGEMDDTQPNPNILNELERQVAALARTAGVAVLTIDFAAGAPFVDKCSALGTNVDGTIFTLTDNADGDSTITWDSWRLPPFGCDPGLTVNDNTGDEFSGKAWIVASPPAGKRAIRVKTFKTGSGLVDARFTVVIR